MRQARGFTFIELLVVTTVILVLTTVGVVSYQAAQRKSRDSKRKSDLEQVRAALEMYRSDNNTYPTDDWDGMINALISENYLTSSPEDPKGYSYYYSSDGLTYRLCAYLEAGGGNNCGDNNCNAPGNCNYQVTNP